MVNIDRRTVIQILGSLMNNPSLLSDTDKYQIEPNEFPQQLDRYIFSAIYNLYAGGAETIHTIDIDTYLQHNELAKQIMERDNGITFLQDCETYCEPGNFHYYYNRFKKLGLLRELQKTGKDISRFYCDDPLNPKASEINENFEQLKTSDIITALKGEVAILEDKYSSNSLIEESTAYSGVRDLIKNLQVTPEVGIKLQGDIFNTITRGGRKGKLYLRSAGTGVGKALPNYTKVPTPNGWKTVGEIRVGDELFDREGKTTKVLAIYPQKEKKQIYEIYFKSGRKIECCEEHLWSFYNISSRNKYKMFTKTTKELFEDPKTLRTSKNGFRYSIPITKPVQYKKKDFSIPPYVMGLILGDGSFRYNSNQKGFCFSSSDEELVKAINDLMNYKQYKRNSEANYNWSFELQDQSVHKNVWVEDILNDYPALWQAKSETKFIPEDYLFGSVEQRFDLLAGLMDTDGSIDKEKGRVSFTTVSPILRDNFVELCESLGMTCTYLIDKRVGKYTTGECYSIHIRASKKDKVKMFKLKRKREIALKYLNNGKRSEMRDRDAIIEIKPTNKFVDMTCFYVDNEEHLFLTEHYIVTHNTRTMVGDACNIAYPIRYEPKYDKWVATGTCEPVLYVMTEQDPMEIQTMILAYLTGINEEVFLYGTFTEKHMDRIMKALDIMEQYQNNMLFAHIPDPSASVIKNLFRRYALQKNVENFFYDYIFSSPAMLNEYRDLKLPEYVCLRLFTTALKNLAVELNAFILTSTQISNDDDKNGGFKDFRNIQGAKQIANLVDFACVMSRPSVEELKLVEGFQSRFHFSPDLVIDVFKNRRGRWTSVRIWSKNDLGTCRRYDLFVTTADNKPIEEFQIVDFTEEKTKEMIELENLYNDGVVSDTLADKLLDNINEVIDNNKIADSIEEAFGDIQETKKRVSRMEFEDLL